MAEDKRFALGLEFSTQSAKAVLLDTGDPGVAYTAKFDYETELPGYGTAGGVLPSADPAVRHTSPAMLTEAVDVLFNRMMGDGIPLDRVGAIKLDAQQHCTVYVNDSFSSRLSHLDGRHSLVEQMRGGFSRPSAPIWEDRSPVAQAKELTSRLAGAGGIEKLTGNKAELRFPASQILKWAAEHPDEYEKSAHILVLSAYVTSLLTGTIAPVDTGDGWGTNLNSLDIAHPGWNQVVLSECEAMLSSAGARGALEPRLGRMVSYDTVIGPVARHFVTRYGLDPHAMVLAGTGDNPATLLGSGGEIVISLGSSYTVNGTMSRIEPSGDEEYNVFGFTPGTAMALSVITNGGKLHSKFRDRYAGGSWKRYFELAGTALPASDEPLMLPYLYGESVPVAPAGIVRDGCDEDDGAANIRALHWSQALSLQLHAAHLSDVSALCIVGGGSANPFLQRAVTELFDAPTYAIANADVAAPLGCAISAARYLREESYEEATARFVQRDPQTVMNPEGTHKEAYRRLRDRYSALEQAYRS